MRMRLANNLQVSVGSRNLTICKKTFCFEDGPFSGNRTFKFSLPPIQNQTAGVKMKFACEMQELSSGLTEPCPVAFLKNKDSSVLAFHFLGQNILHLTAKQTGSAPEDYFFVNGRFAKYTGPSSQINFTISAILVDAHQKTLETDTIATLELELNRQ
jgi:hypothetical protein